jgi:hypothetical protein
MNDSLPELGDTGFSFEELDDFCGFELAHEILQGLQYDFFVE